MAYISSIDVDGKNVKDYLFQHAKLIKIVKSDKLLVDHLYLIINKTDYKGPLPQENSIVQFKIKIAGKKEEYTENFFINKEDNVFSGEYLTELEKAIANEENSIVFYGLSISRDFINKHNLVNNSTSQPKPYIFKDKTLEEILEYMKTALGLTKLIINHPYKNTKITYFAANKVHKRPDDTYTKTPLEQVADIFYAVANIRNNTLYFTNKCSYSKELRTTLSLSLEQIERKEYVKCDFNDYNGVEYSYFEGSTNNIKKSYLGAPPFLKLDNIYEKSLAYRYAQSKYDEITEKQILNLTLSGVYSRLPGCYLQIRKSKGLEASDKCIDDILGCYSVKECVITYKDQQEKKQEPQEAGPSNKKVKLEPILTWSTSMKLALGTKLSQNYT